jgi:hypothetical protein
MEVFSLEVVVSWLLVWVTFTIIPPKDLHHLSAITELSIRFFHLGRLVILRPNELEPAHSSLSYLSLGKVN